MIRAGDAKKPHTAVGRQSRVQRSRRLWLLSYFGAAAGEAEKGYYSYELGGWHIIVLDSSAAKWVAVAAIHLRGSGCKRIWRRIQAHAHSPTGTVHGSVQVQFMVTIPI